MAASLSLACSASAFAHGGQPRVVDLVFPDAGGRDVWAITDSQGLYARVDGEFRWLCEDAVVLNAGFQSVVPVGDEVGNALVVATNFGVFLTDDGGCTFAPVGGALIDVVPLGVYGHPTRPNEILVATQTPQQPNDVYVSDDGGRSFRAAGLEVDGRVRSILRAEASPERVFVSHAQGVARSDDGGRVFTAVTLGPPGVNVAPEEFLFLAGHPVNPDEVWAVIERFPDSIVIRSRDAGQSWMPMLTVADTPSGFVFDASGESVLLTSRFDAWHRSEDGGDTWNRAAEGVPLIGCLERQPGTDRIWACSNVFFMGPWVLAYSDDFAASFSTVLPHYNGVSRTWGCAAETPAGQACEGLCPGQEIGADCSLDNPAQPPAPATSPPVPPTGPASLNPGGQDQGVVDSDASTEPPHTEARPSGDAACAFAWPHRDAPLALFALALLVLRRRPR